MTPRLPRLTALFVAAVAALACSSTIAHAAAPAADSALRWFKGNLHTHSLWSDGDDYPEMIADWFKRACVGSN
jgi:ABC-type glycerol-3-phosphate transport system substrate-binding protein